MNNLKKSELSFFEDLLQAIVPYIEVLALVSIITFITSIAIIPWYIGRLPRDYFLNLFPAKRPKKEITFYIFLVFRNIFGSFLLISGIIMLFIPGQGLLTMLFGILCLSFPRKQRLILKLISLKSIQKSLNWTRKKMSKPPFLWS